MTVLLTPTGDFVRESSRDFARRYSGFGKELYDRIGSWSDDACGEAITFIRQEFIFPSRLFKSWTTRSGSLIRQVLPFPSKAFLVTIGGLNILVDSGPPPAGKTLERRLEKAGIRKLDYLILTHTHFDHAGNACRIKERYNPTVIVHGSEADLLASGRTLLPKGTNCFTKILIGHSHRIAGRFHVTPCGADILADDRLDLPLPGAEVYVLHNPGHTCGSVSLVVDAEIALVGDAFVGRRSIYPPFADDEAGLVRSWGKLLDTGCRLFLPAHGTAKSRELLEKSYLDCRTDVSG